MTREQFVYYIFSVIFIAGCLAFASDWKHHKYEQFSKSTDETQSNNNNINDFMGWLSSVYLRFFFPFLIFFKARFVWTIYMCDAFFFILKFDALMPNLSRTIYNFICISNMFLHLKFFLATVRLLYCLFLLSFLQFYLHSFFAQFNVESEKSSNVMYLLVSHMAYRTTWISCLICTVNYSAKFRFDIMHFWKHFILL